MLSSGEAVCYSDLGRAAIIPSRRGPFSMRSHLWVFAIFCSFLWVNCAGCSSGDPATDRLLQQSFYGNVGTTQVVDGPDECSGMAGSVAPPFSVHGCIGELHPGAAPPTLGNVFLRGVGLQSTGSTYHVALEGLERFWVRQTSENTCWAAALETARAYLGLQRQSQKAIYEMVAKSCPALRTQPAGATMYQIVLGIRRLSHGYDKQNITSHFCDDIRCVISAMQQHHPVIVLNSGHAVLLASIDYVVSPEGIDIERYQILDPAGKGALEEKPRSAFCGADAFIAL